jgi:hypothetical protein
MRFRLIVRSLWARRGEWRGKAIGAGVGLAAGWFGCLVGFVIGGLTDVLLKQARADRALIGYLESPGAVDFQEPSPGAAAFCALSTLVAASAPDRRSGLTADHVCLAERIARRAAERFGVGRTALPILESFVRLASLRLDLLNPDLLAESFAARRKPFRDAAVLAASLAEFATGKGGADLVVRICACVGPGVTGGREKGASAEELVDEDPWKVLGLEADASTNEVKTAFRRLAVNVHPDSVGAEDDAEKSKAAENFIHIAAAYREIKRAKGPTQ